MGERQAGSGEGARNRPPGATEPDAPSCPPIPGLIAEPFIAGTGPALEAAKREATEIRYEPLSFTIRVTPRIARLLMEGQNARRRILYAALFPEPRR